MSLARRWNWPVHGSLMAVVVLAAALRLTRLTSWSLNGDEMNTLRDSVYFEVLSGSKPLLFLLNHYLVAPWTQFDEFGLRLLPMLFGVLAVPVVFWMGRHLLGPSVGLLAATLVALSPWHVYWSQYARYYTLVFLLSAAFPILLFSGVTERNARRTAVGALAALLAVLAHPSAGLVLAGWCAWFAWWSTRRGIARPKHSGVLITAFALVLIAAVVVGVRLSLLLVRWYHSGQNWGFAAPTLLLSYTGWLVPTMVVFSAAGWVWMRVAGDRSVSLLLACVIIGPVVLLAPLSFFVPVSTAYLFATAPFMFLLAAFFVERVAALAPKGVQRTTVVSGFLLAVLAASGPTLVSHYIDGNRFDYRSAARYVTERAGRQATVLSDRDDAFSYYSGSHRVTRLDRDKLISSPETVSGRGDEEPEAIWLVVAVRRRGGLYDQALGVASDWVRANCSFESSFGRPRLDHRYNELQVYVCR